MKDSCSHVNKASSNWELWSLIKFEYLFDFFYGLDFSNSTLGVPSDQSVPQARNLEHEVFGEVDWVENVVEDHHDHHNKLIS